MKISNKILLYSIIFYIAIILVQHSFFLIKINEINSLTAKATGEIQFCINHPPQVNYTCPLTINQNDPYNCLVNATDADGDIIDFQLDFIPPPALFNMTSDWEIDFTPGQNDTGNTTFRITVWDYSVCSNNLAYEDFTLEVLNVNDPPVLIQPIPNQTWNQGDPELQAFDLDFYFWDPDGDPLNYTWTVLSNIQVRIDSDNIIYFWSLPTWNGDEIIIFFAWDPYMANASSNDVLLRVVDTSEEEEPSPSGGGGGGGGGGFVPSCIPQWYCRPWGPCLIDNLRYRECYDLNNCSSDFGMPNVTEPCNFVHTCYDGIQAPDEEGIDCGGPCPSCGSCYDKVCNNNEDCLKGLTDIADCGGPCQACDYLSNETCYDSICNNGEDCTFGWTELPDCGGSCDACPIFERPQIVQAINWALIVTVILLIVLAGYIIKQTYPNLKIIVQEKKKKFYEERLLLETKISESIYDSLIKLEERLNKESIEKLILLFSTTVRRYFKNLLGLKYEFTYDELIHEINSRDISPTMKSVLKKFFDRSLELEFSGKNVSKQELKAMISEFKQIVAHTSEEPLKTDEKEATDKKGKKELTQVDKMFVKISEAETVLRRGDINSAYFKYMRVVHEYKLLPVKEKEKLHGFISRLYEEIKLAREKFAYENDE